MNKKSMLNILSERIETLQDKLNNATTDKEKLIYTELIEQAHDDVKRVKSRNVKKIIYRVLGTIMLVMIITQGVIIVKEYLELQQYNRAHAVDDSIGRALDKRNDSFN